MKGSDAAVQLQVSGRRRARQLWAAHVGAVLGLSLLLIALNWPVVSAAITVWRVSPTYSHCFFIIPVSAFLIWLRRSQVMAVTPRAAPSELLLAIPVLLLQVAGTILSVTEVQQFALVALIEVLVLSVLGRTVFRIIAFPMLFLFFLVPTGEYLVAPMQDFTTWFISAGLTALGILHHTEGTVIELLGGVFRVAEACAGLRFLIATVAIGALFCYLNYRRWWKIALYMLASIAVPVLANGVRALGIVLLAHFSNNRIATGADHLIYGWGFSVVILGFLMFVGARFADPVLTHEQPSRRKEEGREACSGSLLFAASLALMVVAVTPAFSYWSEHRPARYDPAPILSLTPSGNWLRGQMSGIWSPVFGSSDTSLRFGVSDGTRASQVDVTVYYYARTIRGHGLISSSNALWDQEDWHLLSRKDVRAQIGGRTVPMQELVLGSGTKRELVWWCYWVDGSFTTSALSVKLANLHTLLDHFPPSAFVALSAEVDTDLDVARDRIKRAANKLGTLPASLERASTTFSQRAD